MNLCLSSEYSTITWFAAGVLGIFSEGELCCIALNLCLILLALVLQILQFCIDNEAFQDCTLGLPYFIFSTRTQEKPPAFLYERGNSS